MSPNLHDLAIVGYACLDSTSSTAAFRGVDATSIIRRPLQSDHPAVGGIAHMVAAAEAHGASTTAVSWTGDDDNGETWRSGIRGHGASDAGVLVRGRRTPSATMLEVETGGTICFFDPGDCHPERLEDHQIDVVLRSRTVLLTVAPRSLTSHLLDLLPDESRLVWAVKHDEDAYDAALLRRILERADVISFSRGERSFLEQFGPLEHVTAAGTLLIETRGADGVRWSVSSASDGPRRTGSVDVDPVRSVDATGAGDTFIGTAAALLAPHDRLSELTDGDIATIIAHAADAARELLLSRAARRPTGTQKEGAIHAER